MYNGEEKTGLSLKEMYLLDYHIQYYFTWATGSNCIYVRMYNYISIISLQCTPYLSIFILNAYLFTTSLTQRMDCKYSTFAKTQLTCNPILDIETKTDFIKRKATFKDGIFSSTETYFYYEIYLTAQSWLVYAQNFIET